MYGQNIFTHFRMTERRVQFEIFEKLEIIDYLLSTG